MNDDNHAPTDAGGATPRMEQTPGSMLRKLREDAGLSHVAVGEALHLTGHYVRALESDEYGKLPGLTFVKGYLRSYARFMKTDVEAVMASFEQHIAGLVDAGQRTEQVQRSRRRHDQALRWAIVTSVILVLGVAGGWWFKGKNASAVDSAASASAQAIVTASVRAAPATPSPQVEPALTELAATIEDTAATLVADSPALVAAAPPATLEQAVEAEATGTEAAEAETAQTEAPVVDETVAEQGLQAGDVLTVTPAPDGSRQVNLVSSGEDLLELSFSGNSWVEIDDGANTRLYNDMLGAGDALTIHGAAPFHLLLGDAANVSVRFNSAAVNIVSDIRADSSARVVLGEPAPATTMNIQTANGGPR